MSPLALAQEASPPLISLDQETTSLLHVASKIKHLLEAQVAQPLSQLPKVRRVLPTLTYGLRDKARAGSETTQRIAYSKADPQLSSWPENRPKRCLAQSQLGSIEIKVVFLHQI
jgi:hypothetical protein